MEEVKTEPIFEAIDKMFSNESFYCGGPIPQYALKDPANVGLLGMELVLAIDIAHNALEKSKGLAKTKYTKKIGQKLIPKIIHNCESKNIRQEFIGGMMLLYLELVEGCEWRHLAKIKNEPKCEKVVSS